MVRPGGLPKEGGFDQLSREILRVLMKQKIKTDRPPSKKKLSRGFVCDEDASSQVRWTAWLAAARPPIDTV